MVNTAADTWLDPEYSVPSSGGYYKFQNGENLIRVLSKPVMGYELWIDGKTQKREKFTDFSVGELKGADEDRFNPGQLTQPKHFWAFPAWSYRDNGVVIVTATQVEIQNGLYSLLSNPKWGALDEYDVDIVRAKGTRVSYAVQPNPKESLPEKILDAVALVSIDMSKYLDGGKVLSEAKLSDKEVGDILDEVEKGK